MLRIVFLSIIHTLYHRQTLDGLRTKLDKDIGHQNYEIILYDGPAHPDALPQYVRSYLHDGNIDLIITAGEPATASVFAETRGRKHSVPIIFWAIPDPVRQKIVTAPESYHNHMTGVCTEPHKETLPVQLMLRSQPKLKNFVVIYLADSQRGESAQEARRMRDTFAKQGFNVLLHPIKSLHVNNKLLMHDFNISDAGFGLECHLIFTQYKSITKNYAIPTNTLFWATGTEAIEEGALFDVSNNFEAIGQAIGVQAIEIVINGKHPRDVPVKCLPNQRKLLINGKVAARKNLPLTPRLSTTLKKCFARHENLETVSSLFVSNDGEKVFESDIKIAFGYNMQLENDAHLHLEGNEKLSSSSLFENEIMLYHIASLTHTKAVIAFGEKQAKLIHDHFKQHQVKKPIICIANAQEAVTSDDWHAHGKSYGVPVVCAKIPPPNIHDMYNMLIAAAPDLEYIIFISGIVHKESLPQHLHNQIEQLKFLSHKHGKRFRVIHAPSQEYLEIFPLSFLQPGFGFIVCGESISYSVMRTLGERFSENNVPAVAGSLTWARWFPLNIGIDADAMAEEKLMPVLKRLLIEKRSPHEHTVTMNYHEWYHAIINEPLAQQLNLDVPAAKMATSNYKTGTIDHAQDITICMGQFTVEERLAMLDEEKASNKSAVLTECYLSKQDSVQS